MRKVKIFLLRRWYVMGGAALLAAAAIFYVKLSGLRQRGSRRTAAAHLLRGAQPEGVLHQLRRSVG